MKIYQIIFIVPVFVLLTGCTTIPDGYSPISKTETEMVYKKYDEFKDTTFYRHKSFFAIGSIKQSIEIYIAENTTKYSRIVFNYYGSNWIFFDNAILINSKGTKVQFSFDSSSKETDILSAQLVREYIDEDLSDSQARAVLNLLKSNDGEIKLRLTGKYYQDTILSKEIVNGLEVMLNRYFQK